MGPDTEMRVKPDTFKPPYDSGAELGTRSWASDSWRTGGAPVWGWMSYDPELDLIYYGTGNPSPYNPEQRLGDNKWTTSVLARRPGDGSLVWAYQFTPHDNWDYDATGAMILADLTIRGTPGQGAGALRQERLCLHVRSRHRPGARRPGVRTGDLGALGGSRHRSPGARALEADRRLQRQRARHLPEPRGRREPRITGGVFATHSSLLHVDQQPVHGLRASRTRPT